eukprot:scaffold6474_cov59-Cylindrotheca_fusiformis.AAC.2
MTTAIMLQSAPEHHCIWTDPYSDEPFESLRVGHFQKNSSCNDGSSSEAAISKNKYPTENTINFLILARRPISSICSQSARLLPQH